MRRAAAVLLALALAACGSSDDDGDDAGGSAAETTTTESAATESTDAGDDDDTTTTGSSSEGEGSDPDSEYCQQADALQNSEGLGLAFGFTPDGGAASPEQVEEAIDAVRGQIDDLRAVAPYEISDDLDLFAEVFSGYFDAVEEAGFAPGEVDPTDPRVTRMSPTDEGSINEDLEAADQRLSDYDAEVCGISAG